MTGANLPVIPATITVHMGSPASNAENVTVSFPEYIKNVASSEIYPTWPEAALRANIYAQISFALNRVYTEYYRARGYPFDITNSTALDQSFIKGRNIFQNISRIVDEIFNSYIVRDGNVEPLFASYCNGTTVTCNGLSQWGTVSLANQGLGPYDILTQYYGDNINLVQNAPVQDIPESLPPVPLAYGSIGNEVRQIQIRLNRVSANYPSIPKIYPPDGVFGSVTDRAVRAFQQIFNLDVDGIVGKATWYKLIYVFNAVKRLNEVVSEGLTYADVEKIFEDTLRLGSTGLQVEIIQYFLETLSEFNNTIPRPPLDGIYGEETQAAVAAFQRAWDLPETGEVDLATWELLYDVYIADLSTLPESIFEMVARPFPGITLRLGSEGDDIRYLQQYINVIAQEYAEVPEIPVTGVFDEATRDAVFVFQSAFRQPITGVVDVTTWENIASLYDTIAGGYIRHPAQFPGYELGPENGAASDSP